jgi:hypothetical protein
MQAFNRAGSSYSLIHLLQAPSGGALFRDVLIIGAGSGNDTAHALRFGSMIRMGSPSRPTTGLSCTCAAGWSRT